jgi:putative tricarboxylic transport membrane protein
MKKFYSIFAFMIVAMLLIAGCSGNTSGSSQGDGEFSVKGDVEFIAPASPGGGSDINGRFLVQTIQEEKFMENNFTVVNKPGASGGVGFAYLNSKNGKDNFLSNINSGQLLATITNNAEHTLEDFTPLATLAIDNYLLVVNSKSEFKTFEDLIKASKTQEINVAVTGTGSEGHLFTALVNKHAGVNFNIVSFQSGGEQITNLLGNHVHASIQKPNEILSLLESGEVTILGSAAEERLPAPFDAPTFVEMGYPEIKLQMFRGFMGPPGMSEEAIAYWEDILKKVSESQKWQEGYIEVNSLQGVYMNSEESKEYWKKDLETYLKLAEEVGVYKP